MNCNLCQSKVSEERAKVPAIGALRQVLQREPKVEDLAGHAFCRKCAPASHGIVQLYSYHGTVTELTNRAKEREKATTFFSMRYALKKAGVK